MLAAVLSVLAAAAPEAAPPAATQPAVAAAAPATASAPAKGKEEMICKSEQVTGSRFAKKVCYSKAEYEAKRQLDQQQLRQNQAGGFQRQ
jgi:hypothetical protein